MLKFHIEEFYTQNTTKQFFIYIPGTRFSREASETFRARKIIAKCRPLRLQSCFINIQEISGVCSSPFLDTDELKMALRARKVSRAFEKRAAIYWINYYPVDSTICFANTYPLDSDLSGG